MIGFKHCIVIALFVIRAVSTQATPQHNILPDKPQPSKTVDKEFVTESSALGTAWLMDTVSTSQRFAWCQGHYGSTLGYQPNCFEGGGFFNNTQDTAKIMGSWAAVDIGTVVLSYEWKRHVHNKYLHPLWRVPLIIGTQGHARAAIHNWSLAR